jgi:hypothetical protein
VNGDESPSGLSTLVAVFVVGLTAAGCGIFTEDPGAPGLTVVGTVTVAGQQCPVPQTSPISGGTVVRVIDSGGAVVESSPLGPGETATDRVPGGCVFPFSVSGLPPDPATYTIAVGDDNRLAQQFTTQQVLNNISVRFVV